MKSAINCDGKILVVGDGDFSFTVSLVKRSDLIPGQIYTSNLETKNSILQHAQASENMRILRDQGVSVFLETDARDLHNHSVISKERFDRIIFNFPLVDRHHIKKNRSLLADFFTSCRSVLTSKGRVLVTLCKGQGGTPADNPVRSWSDSWQIVAMATNASFLLREVLPFDPSEFPEYHSVGFRFQDKSFNVTNALTHIFEEGSLVEHSDVHIRGVIHKDGTSYSCSSYVASHFKRNLLEEARNPVCILKKLLEEKVRRFPFARSLFIEHDSSPIIPSHTSMAYVINEEGSDVCPNTDMFVSEENKMAANKECKNSEDLKGMLNKPHLAHGVVDNRHDVVKGESIQSKDDVKIGVGVSACDRTTDGVAPFKFLPCDRDNVYILVRKHSTDLDKAGHDSDCDSDNTPGGGQKNKELDLVENDVCHDFSLNKTASGTCSRKSDEEGSGEFVIPRSSQQASCCPESPTAIYHYRTSLLESLPYLCGVWCKSRETSINHMEGSSSNSNRGVSNSNLSSSTHTQFECGKPISLPRDHQVDSIPCLVASGQCLLPCHIAPHSSPVRHEMVIAHQTDIAVQNDDVSPPEGSPVKKKYQSNNFHSISSNIVSLLGSLVNNNTQNSISFSTSTIKSNKINIEGFSQSQLISQIVVRDSSSTDSSKDNDNINSYSNPLGLILSASIGIHHYHVTTLNLDRLACCLCGISDWRILSSESDKFLNQFYTESAESANFSLCQYSPFSLYSMRFVHDLSFWEKSGGVDSDDGLCSGSVFDEFGLYEAIRNVAGDLVSNVSLVDVYEDPETKRRSRCYRLHFVSPDKCLPYVTSWTMQSRIRMEVARSLGVKLR